MTNKIIVKFPSPCGVTVIKSYDLRVYSMYDLEFPSPCGVTVIKSDNLSDDEIIEA